MTEGKAKAANLQLTTKQAARLLNVSERSVYLARRVRLLRPDLEPRIMGGELSLNEAHCIATGKAKPTSWDRLASAWRNASDEDRERLAFVILRAQAKGAGDDLDP